MAGRDRIWEVTGGSNQGGILVRQGKNTTSEQLEQRLAMGALVRQLAMENGRLQYELASGTGPHTGWVSTSLKDKPLLRLLENGGAEKLAKASAMDGGIPVPAILRPHRDVAPIFLLCGHLDAFKPILNQKKFKESCAERLPGQLYGLALPTTPEDFASEGFGAKWLTEAMLKAGTLPKSNSVAHIVNWKRFDGGGSGPKVLFQVEYAMEDVSLDKTLFAKFPWTLEENEQQKFVEQGQGKFGDNWGGEINFYRFISAHVPFPVPKFYFGDLNRTSHQAIIINAAVPWPEAGKVDYKPYEVLPPCGKCEDYTLRDPSEYYFAIMRRQGTLAALGRTGKLGPEAAKVHWYNYTPRTDVFCSMAMPGHELAMRKFIEETAPHIFPEDMRAASFLDKFVVQLPAIMKAQPDISKYVYQDEAYVGFQHQNGNTDNAYFYRRPDEELHCGLLDWGSFAQMSFASAFQGSFVSCLAEMLAEYDDRLVCAWADAYHSNGGPPIDVEELLLQYRMVSAISIYGCIASVRMLAVPEMKAAIWDKVQSWNDDLIRKNFGLKFTVSMMYNRALLWKLRGDTYWASFESWMNRGKVGPAKAAEAAAAAERHAEILKLSVKELKAEITAAGLSAAGAAEKEDLARLVERARAHKNLGASFVASAEWKRVPKGVAIPPGLEVKFDLGKGCNFARLAPGHKT